MNRQPVSGAEPPTAGGCPSKPTRAERRMLGAILAAFVALSITYSVVIPLGYAPDEPRHYAYVRLLMERGLLPRTYPDGRERGGAIAVHPPLYYAVLGILYYPARAVGGAWGAQRLYRLLSTALGVGALWFIWCVAREILPGRKGLPLLITAVTALTPHFLMDQSIINNDAAANFACPFFVWFVLGRKARGWRMVDAVYCGVLLGLCALVKGQVLACLPPVLLVVLAWDHGRDFWRKKAFWARAAVGMGLLLALAGWWYARNLALYGQITYLPTEYRGIPSGMSLATAWVEGIVPALMLRAFVGLFESLWAQIGWFPAALAREIYVVLALLCGLALIGWASLRRFRRREELLGHMRELVALLMTFCVTYALVFYIAIFQHIGWYQGGRYLLVGLGGVAAFLVIGWDLIVPARLRYVGTVAVLGLFGLLNVLSLWQLITYLNPTYAPGANFWTPIAGT